MVVSNPQLENGDLDHGGENIGGGSGGPENPVISCPLFSTAVKWSLSHA